MIISFISDTHTKHNQVVLPGGDVLVHSGDLSSRGSFDDLEDFLLWFSKQPYKYKIFISGNHDFCFQDSPEKCHAILKEYEEYNIIYLQDSSVTIENIKIWGSPWQPEFYNWAFNLPRGQKLADKWALIPEDIDILITHGPPYGILDEITYNNSRDKHQGCKDLLDRIAVVKPKIHCFGHIHESAGYTNLDSTFYINASVVNLNYFVVNNPITLEIVPNKKIKINN